MVNIAELRKKKKKKEEEIKKDLSKDFVEIEKSKEVQRMESPSPEIKEKELPLKEEKDLLIKKEIKIEEGEKDLFLIFSIGKEIYGLPIDYVQEIIPLYPITLVPNAPPECLGIISLRGIVFPVLNIGIFLGQNLKEETEDTRLIVLRTQEDVVCVKVDRVLQTLSIPLKNIEPPPATVKDEKGLIMGVYPYKKRLLILLKAEQI